jgi:hypothetical protein
MNRGGNGDSLLRNQGVTTIYPFIEFRPNDLASPRLARLTDDLLRKISIVAHRRIGRSAADNLRAV